jgi:hypothetical protein
MSYSHFTIRKVKQTFGINTIEGQQFLLDIQPITASNTRRRSVEDPVVQVPPRYK